MPHMRSRFINGLALILEVRTTIAWLGEGVELRLGGLLAQGQALPIDPTGLGELPGIDPAVTCDAGVVANDGFQAITLDDFLLFPVLVLLGGVRQPRGHGGLIAAAQQHLVRGGVIGVLQILADFFGVFRLGGDAGQHMMVPEVHGQLRLQREELSIEVDLELDVAVRMRKAFTELQQHDVGLGPAQKAQIPVDLQDDVTRQAQRTGLLGIAPEVDAAQAGSLDLQQALQAHDDAIGISGQKVVVGMHQALA
jgi:hypothetical protein